LAQLGEGLGLGAAIAQAAGFGQGRDEGLGQLGGAEGVAIEVGA